MNVKSLLNCLFRISGLCMTFIWQNRSNRKSAYDAVFVVRTYRRKKNTSAKWEMPQKREPIAGCYVKLAKSLLSNVPCVLFIWPSIHQGLVSTEIKVFDALNYLKKCFLGQNYNFQQIKCHIGLFFARNVVTVVILVISTIGLCILIFTLEPIF